MHKLHGKKLYLTLRLIALLLIEHEVFIQQNINAAYYVLIDGRRQRQQPSAQESRYVFEKAMIQSRDLIRCTTICELLVQN